MQDIAQADTTSIMYALAGGIVWNLGTLLLVAAMAIAGMAVGFPIGGGLAWVLGILVNFMISGAQGITSQYFFIGVGLIVAAIYFCMMAYKKLSSVKKVQLQKV